MNNNFDDSKDELNVNYFFSHILRYKKLIFIITTIFAVFSIFYALSLPNYFKSEALLRLSDTSDTEFNSSGASGLGSLASLAGINIGSSGDKVNKHQLAVETVKSREFLKSILIEKDILANIVAAKDFDFKQNKVIFNKEIYDPERELWLDKSRKPSSPPNHISTHKIYVDMVKISHNKRTGFLEISVEHFSPFFAKEFLEIIISSLNSQMRTKDFKSSQDALDYLLEVSKQNNKLELQFAVNALVEKELQRQMLTDIRDEYFVEVIDPAFVPIQKSKPSRSRICISITFLGLFFGLLVSIVYEIFVRKNSDV